MKWWQFSKMDFTFHRLLLHAVNCQLTSSLNWNARRYFKWKINGQIFRNGQTVCENVSKNSKLCKLTSQGFSCRHEIYRPFFIRKSKTGPCAKPSLRRQIYLKSIKAINFNIPFAISGQISLYMLVCAFCQSMAHTNDSIKAKPDHFWHSIYCNWNCKIIWPMHTHINAN